MKISITLISLFFICGNLFGQCECQKIYRNDGTITQCNPLPIGSNDNSQIGISIASNGQDIFLAVTMRFSKSAQDFKSDLAIRLVDNKLLRLKLVNSQLSYIGNSQVANGIYTISSDQKQPLSKSNLKTISFELKDGLVRTYQAKLNNDIVINQLKCLDE